MTEQQWAEGFVEWASAQHEARMAAVRASGREPTQLEQLHSIYSVRLADYPVAPPPRGLFEKLRALLH